MAIVLNGTSGITNDSGYTGDGVSFADSTPANTLVTTSGGNVGIGTSSPNSRLSVAGASQITHLYTGSPSVFAVGQFNSSGDASINNTANAPLLFATNNTERARIDSSGNLLVGTTSATGASKFVVAADTTTANPMTVSNTRSTAATDYSVLFYRNASLVGSIQTSLSATSYVTSSDYRLKENIQPMTGALAKVAALKPVTYTWKSTGEADEGFIAHELAEVCPSAVTGEKDAVDAEGNPIYQGIDTSFLTATLAAALQELHQIVKDQAAEIAELKAKLP